MSAGLGLGLELGLGSIFFFFIFFIAPPEGWLWNCYVPKCLRLFVARWLRRVTSVQCLSDGAEEMAFLTTIESPY